MVASVNARILRGVRRTDVLLMEDTLYRMKTQLIAMDAVPGVREESAPWPKTAFSTTNQYFKRPREK